MQKNKIELEDLLKLKRAEHPSEADWSRFDYELKGRLLREAVGKNKGLSIFAKTSKFALATACSFSALACAYFYFGFSMHKGTSQLVPETAIIRLPNLETSFATNELSQDSSEKHISAQLDNSMPEENFVFNSTKPQFYSTTNGISF